MRWAMGGRIERAPVLARDRRLDRRFRAGVGAGGRTSRTASTDLVRDRGDCRANRPADPSVGATGSVPHLWDAHPPVGAHLLVVPRGRAFDTGLNQGDSGSDVRSRHRTGGTAAPGEPTRAGPALRDSGEPPRTVDDQPHGSAAGRNPGSAHVESLRDTRVRKALSSDIVRTARGRRAEDIGRVTRRPARRYGRRRACPANGRSVAGHGDGGVRGRRCPPRARSSVWSGAPVGQVPGPRAVRRRSAGGRRGSRRRGRRGAHRRRPARRERATWSLGLRACVHVRGWCVGCRPRINDHGSRAARGAELTVRSGADRPASPEAEDLAGSGRSSA